MRGGGAGLASALSTILPPPPSKQELADTGRDLLESYGDVAFEAHLYHPLSSSPSVFITRQI